MSNFTIELIGWVVTVAAVIGVIQNNHRRRTCFVIWWFTNLTRLVLHLWVGVVSLAVCDAAFFILAVAGFVQWGRPDCRLQIADCGLNDNDETDRLRAEVDRLRAVCEKIVDHDDAEHALGSSWYTGVPFRKELDEALGRPATPTAPTATVAICNYGGHVTVPRSAIVPARDDERPTDGGNR